MCLILRKLYRGFVFYIIYIYEKYGMINFLDINYLFFLQQNYICFQIYNVKDLYMVVIVNFLKFKNILFIKNFNLI